jgi:hypothetical protein
VTRIGELGTTLAATSNRRTLQRNIGISPLRYELGFCIPEDGILHSHRRENLKSYQFSLDNVLDSSVVKFDLS